MMTTSIDGFLNALQTSLAQSVEGITLDLATLDRFKNGADLWRISRWLGKVLHSDEMLTPKSSTPPPMQHHSFLETPHSFLKRFILNAL